jgi:hypothetical protein
MTMSAGGEMTPSRKKGDNASWTDVNLTGLKNKKNHAIDSAATNGQ